MTDRQAYEAGYNAAVNDIRSDLRWLAYRPTGLLYALLVAMLVGGFLLGVAVANVAASRPEQQLGLEVSPAAPTGTSQLEPALGGPPLPSPGRAMTAAASHGIATTYGPGYDGLTAARLPRGTVITVCGARCRTLAVNDYGPRAGFKPDRIVDLDVPNFEWVCAKGWRAGWCYVTLTVGGLRPPETSTGGRP